MAGKFELYKDSHGKYRFRLKAGNGEIIAVGEAYESRTGALGGIDSVRRNAADAELVDQTRRAVGFEHRPDLRGVAVDQVQAAARRLSSHSVSMISSRDTRCPACTARRPNRTPGSLPGISTSAPLR